MVRPGEDSVVEESDVANVDTAKASLEESHDPYFPPIVSLPLVEVNWIFVNGKIPESFLQFGIATSEV